MKNRTRAKIVVGSTDSTGKLVFQSSSGLDGAWIMYVSSTLSYLVRTVFLLYVINSTSAYRKQNLTVKNVYTSGISEKARKDFRSSRPSSADKSLQGPGHKVNFSLRESHVASLEIAGDDKHNADERFEKQGLQNLITGKVKKNDTSETGVVKRTKRCLLTMMALGGIASMAADWLLPPAPPPTTPPPVWVPPPTTRPPVWVPPPTTRPPVRVPPPTTRPPVWVPPPTTRPPVWVPPRTTRPPVRVPPPTTRPSVWVPPRTNPPTTTTTTSPPTTITTTRPPTTITTTIPPTTTTTEVPTTPTMKPTIDSTTLLPDVPTMIQTGYKSTGVDTSIEPKSDDRDPNRKVQEPASEYNGTDLKIVRDKWMNATAGATEMGLVVMDGVPEYNISTAMVVKKTEKKIAFNNIEVVEFEHPLSKEKILVPLHGGDEYVNPETREVFLIFVDNDGRTFLIFKGIGHSITEKYPDGNSDEDTWDIIVNETPNIARVTKWGSIVVEGVPKYNMSEATIVNKSEKKADSNGTEVLEFVHPFTNETVQVPLNGGDEFVKRNTRERFIIFVDNQNRTIVIFKGIDHSIIGKNPDGNSGYDTWDIIVNETPNIARVTEWGSIVVSGVPKYNVSEGTIVNKSEKKEDSNGTEVLEFVHPFTNETVQVPFNGGDEFIKRSTREVFIIFVDNQNRTILIFKGIDNSITGKYPDVNSGDDTWDIIVNETPNIVSVTKWGSMVVGGVPKYNISEGTIVNRSEKKIDSNANEVLEFVHPFTNETVQVPFNGGDEFVKRNTREVFIIFVDNQNRTILIFKGIDNSITGKYPDVNSGDGTWDIIVNETPNIVSVTKWGSLVVGGGPQYDISEATIVDETEKKTNSNGTEVLEFVHPFTHEIVQVPLNGGDEFVKRKTREVYIIFVDIYGRTLLIFKGIDNSITGKYPDGNSGEDTWDIIVNETTNIVRLTKWGSIVVGGVPQYDMSEATIVEETEKKTDSNGTDVLEFVHPFTNEIVQVPLNGGDEFLKRNTQEVFIIFVDNQNRTILIFKGIDNSITEKSPDGNNGEDTWNIIPNESTNVIRVTKWGSIVVGGVPKYNISEATIVNRSEKKIDSNGIEVLEFVHPFTNGTIQVPLNGGDEFVKRESREVYIIFVDNQNRTILNFKGIDYSLPLPGNMTNSTDLEENIYENSTAKVKIIKDEWGSIVVNGVPEYDISSALIITQTKKKIGFDGTIVLEFVHPITQEKIQVPLNGGDEYVIPKTHHIFIIFVDVYKRTLLILKDAKQPVVSNSESEEKTNKIEDKTDECWGTMVVGGSPKYDIAKATFVMKTRQKMKNGVSVIEFTHPITLQVIDVPYKGGDEYVNPKTKQIFVIFVDILDRTMLILKRSVWSVDSRETDESNVDSDEKFDDYANTHQYKNKKWGSVVVRGVPKYYMSKAKIVMDVKRKIGSNGISVLEFKHPVTGQTIQVPVDGGDEYVNPKTREVFVICVDLRGRTLLIFKGLDTSASTNEMSNNNAENYDENSAEFDEDPDLYSVLNTNVVTPDSMPFEDFVNYN